MKEVVGNLWDKKWDAHWRCITTNGYVKNNGECVMGRGCAADAAHKYPELPKELGLLIKKSGNNLHIFKKYKLVTFPVKHVWWHNADMKLIVQSAFQLAKFIIGMRKAVLPRPGCGNGHLIWEDVRRWIYPILDDRISVITF